MRLYTIGFTKSSAERFFGRLKTAQVRTLVDVRLHNVSQLAGFAKKEDLAYFTRELVGADYHHALELAPTEPMLAGYKKGMSGWAPYAAAFLALIAERRIEHVLEPAALDGACLLCSEPTPHHCHRRLVAEYLAERWSGVEIVHL